MISKRLSACLVGSVAIGLSTSAHASVVFDGQIDWLGGPLPGTPNAFDGDIVSEVDQYSITVNTPGTITFDILSWEGVVSFDGWTDLNGDGDDTFIDPHIYLFNDDGSLDAGDLVDSNDDSSNTAGDGADDGSIDSLDSFLSVSLTAGDYIFAVGGYFLSTANAIAGVNPGTGDGLYPIDSLENVAASGDYRVTITGDVTVNNLPAVPEASEAMVIMLGVSGLLLGVRRRKSARQ